MLKFNYHSHTNYCDGFCAAEDMIKSAIEQGLRYYGVSSHAPLPFDTDWIMKDSDLDQYIEEILRLKEKYKDKISVLVGLEVDYLPDFEMLTKKDDLISGIDYIIGSVHFLGKLKDTTRWTVDYDKLELEKGIKESFNGNTKTAIKTYYKLIGDMAETMKPDIIAHLDLIKKNNSDNYFFDESETWYVETVKNCLERISKTSSIIEINTGGVARGYMTEFYPSDWILKEVLDMKIPVTISSDSHKSEDVAFGFDDAVAKLESIGFGKVYCLTENGWQEIDIRSLKWQKK
ncbi:MAG: histidinol-phosphatase HisJ [Dethiosulfatibacter sp.]|nr:histidinol-phosphatase HisJ [Dethiosulfatibacter sp.]